MIDYENYSTPTFPDIEDGIKSIERSFNIFKSSYTILEEEFQKILREIDNQHTQGIFKEKTIQNLLSESYSYLQRKQQAILKKEPEENLEERTNIFLFFENKNDSYQKQIDIYLPVKFEDVPKPKGKGLQIPDILVHKLIHAVYTQIIRCFKETKNNSIHSEPSNYLTFLKLEVSADDPKKVLDYIQGVCVEGLEIEIIDVNERSPRPTPITGNESMAGQTGDRNYPPPKISTHNLSDCEEEDWWKKIEKQLSSLKNREIRMTNTI